MIAQQYYVLFIEQDVEPTLFGPYGTEEERDDYALILRANDTDDLPSGIFPVEVDERGRPSVDSYSGAFFDGC
jgi:hypothetical protein